MNSRHKLGRDKKGMGNQSINKSQNIEPSQMARRCTDNSHRAHSQPTNTHLNSSPAEALAERQHASCANDAPGVSFGPVFTPRTPEFTFTFVAVAKRRPALIGFSDEKQRRKTLACDSKFRFRWLHLPDLIQVNQ